MPDRTSPAQNASTPDNPTAGSSSAYPTASPAAIGAGWRSWRRKPRHSSGIFSSSAAATREPSTVTQTWTLGRLLASELFDDTTRTTPVSVWSPTPETTTPAVPGTAHVTLPRALAYLLVSAYADTGELVADAAGDVALRNACILTRRRYVVPDLTAGPRETAETSPGAALVFMRWPDLVSQSLTYPAHQQISTADPDPVAAMPGPRRPPTPPSGLLAAGNLLGPGGHAVIALPVDDNPVADAAHLISASRRAGLGHVQHLMVVAGLPLDTNAALSPRPPVDQRANEDVALIAFILRASPPA